MIHWGGDGGVGAQSIEIRDDLQHAQFFVGQLAQVGTGLRFSAPLLLKVVEKEAEVFFCRPRSPGRSAVQARFVQAGDLVLDLKPLEVVLSLLLIHYKGLDLALDPLAGDGGVGAQSIEIRDDLQHAQFFVGQPLEVVTSLLLRARFLLKVVEKEAEVRRVVMLHKAGLPPSSVTTDHRHASGDGGAILAPFVRGGRVGRGLVALRHLDEVVDGV